MPTAFEIVGPIELPFYQVESGSHKYIRPIEVERFWALEESQSIASRKGCYVFALRASRGFRPWYIGMTVRGMRQEIFQPHKRGIYNDVLVRGNKGTPVFFFVVAKSSRGRPPKNAIYEIETFLIQAAVTKYGEDQIMNDRKTWLPRWQIEGVIRGTRGRPPEQAIRFRKMMGLW